jgi:hypothetical protein
MSDDERAVPAGILGRLREVCAALPEVHEESAWTGTRWRIRTKTFAHVLNVDDGHPAAHARAAGTDGPVTVVVFRSSGGELVALTNTGPPFFRPRWGANVVGMVLDAGSDWDEVAELLTDSYCIQAPKRLAALVDRPPTD